MAAIGLTQPVQASHNQRYERLSKAGVLIPISNPQRLPDGKLQFDVYAKGINKVDYLWSTFVGKDFGYYLEGTSKDKNRPCPFFKKSDKTYFHNETIKSMSHYRVTLGMSDHLMDTMIEAQCAISPKPDKDAAPDAQDGDYGVENYLMGMMPTRPRLG